MRLLDGIYLVRFFIDFERIIDTEPNNGKNP